MQKDFFFKLKFSIRCLDVDIYTCSPWIPSSPSSPPSPCSIGRETAVKCHCFHLQVLVQTSFSKHITHPLAWDSSLTLQTHQIKVIQQVVPTEKHTLVGTLMKAGHEGIYVHQSFFTAQQYWAVLYLLSSGSWTAWNAWMSFGSNRSSITLQTTMWGDVPVIFLTCSSRFLY